MLRKNSLLLVVASLSLGLGLGLNTTIFSAVHALLFRAPNIERADDLVNLYSVKEGVRDSNPSSYADFLDLRAGLRSVDALVGHSLAMVNYERQGLPTLQFGAIVTSGYFELLGTRPSLGRLLQDDDFATEAPVVVVSHRFWQDELNGDPAAIGSPIRLGTRVFEVVGVLPEDFTGLSRPPPEYPRADHASGGHPAHRRDRRRRSRGCARPHRLARPAIPERHRAPGGRRNHRRGASRSEHLGEGARAGISGQQPSARRAVAREPRRTVRSRDRRRVGAGRDPAPYAGCARVARRVRQRREPAARESSGSKRRDGAADGARRESGANRQPIARRKLAVRSDLRCRGVGRGVTCRSIVRPGPARAAVPAGAGVAARYARAAVHSRVVARDHSGVRPDPRAAREPARTRAVAALGRCDDRSSRPLVSPVEYFGRRPGRRQLGADRRRRLAVSQSRCGARRRRRLRGGAARQRIARAAERGAITERAVGGLAAHRGPHRSAARHRDGRTDLADAARRQPHRGQVLHPGLHGYRSRSADLCRSGRRRRGLLRRTGSSSSSAAA